MGASPLLTVDEAIEFTGLSKSSFYRRVKDDNIPKVKKGGKPYYEKDVLEEFFNQDSTSHGLARVIAFTNQKGGVGKTTTALNLGQALWKANHKVLVIDMDPQANLTEQFVPAADDLKYSVVNVLGIKKHGFSTVPVDKAIVKTKTIDLLPSNIQLSHFDSARDMNDFDRLSKVVRQLKGRYDYILIDCGPTLDVKLGNVLACADIAIVPARPSKFSIQGLKDLSFTTESAKDKNPNLRCFVLVNEYREKEQLSQVIKLIDNYFPRLKSEIPKAIDIDKVQMLNEHLDTFRPSLFKHYSLLADEVEALCKN